MHDEPLLPPEPPPGRPLPVFLVGAAALAAGVVLASLLLGKKSGVEPATPADVSAPVRPKVPGAPPDLARRPVTEEDGLARDLAARAEARARAEAARTKAERDFDDLRRRTRRLSDAEAVLALKEFAARGDETIRARTEAEVVAVENASREAYNRLVAEAHEQARPGTYEAAAARFETLRKGAIPEVAAKCDEAASKLRAAGRDAARYADARKADEAARSFREGPAAKVLALVRWRRYEEALREFDGALANPAFSTARPALDEERAALAAAAAFWDGFQKALQARLDQTVTIPLSDGTRIAGRLARLLPDRAVLESGDVSLEARYETIHLDPVVGWTLGRTLPDESPTYLKAALFFFCEGRDDLARVYLATARELSAPIEPTERVFRSGFLRAASFPPKGGKSPK